MREEVVTPELQHEQLAVTAHEHPSRLRKLCRKTLVATGVALTLVQGPGDLTNSDVRAESTVESSNPCYPGSVVRRGPVDKPWVAITIDDGPDDNTLAVMDAFDANGETGDAEFFMVGQMAQRNPAIARQVAERGFGISNHSMTHQYDTSIITSEIKPAQSVLNSITSVTPRYFRSPGLTQGSNIQAELADLGMCNIFTDFDPHDWVSPRISATQICANIRAGAGPGSIILLHDGGTHAQTVLAFQTCIFPTLRQMGLEVVPLPQLLSGEEPASSRIPPGGVVKIKAGDPYQTVVGTLTVDAATGPGYLQAYACDEGKTETSDLNYVANEPNANLLAIRLDSAGKFCVSANVSSAHIIYDLVAEVGSDQMPLHNPVRDYDSRIAAGKLAAGSVLRLRLAGPDQIVFGQLTTDRSEQPGFLTTFTCDKPLPPTSNLNYVTGRPASNRFIVQANNAGEVCVYTLSTTDIIVDRSGELDSNAISFAANRLIDTRSLGSAVAAGDIVKIPIGVPNQTLFGQLTTDRAEKAGYATLYPCLGGVPLASSVNFKPDRPRSSASVVTTDANGDICIFVSAKTDVIFDLLGQAGWQSHKPVRLIDTRQ